MRIGLYGGTFDPIHHAHLILARQARETLALDRVIFVPAGRSPFKQGVEMTPPDVRLEMVRAAVADEPGFDVDPIEVVRGGVSYTIDTVAAFEQRFAGADFYLLLGLDQAREFAKWHRADELADRVQLVVFERPGSGRLPSSGPTLHTIEREIDISATDIRARVAQGLGIRYLVPEPVREIIVRDGLYQTREPNL